MGGRRIVSASAARDARRKRPLHGDRRGAGRYDQGYTIFLVKTAVSIPDAIFDSAERVIERLGISRSELYARAVSAFVEAHRTDGVTEALDRVHSDHTGDLDPVLRELQAASLPREEW